MPAATIAAGRPPELLTALQEAQGRHDHVFLRCDGAQHVRVQCGPSEVAENGHHYPAVLLAQLRVAQLMATAFFEGRRISDIPQAC